MLFRKNKRPDMNPNEKINYNEFDLLDALHARCFQSFSLTLDTADYVPQDYINKVCKRIYKATKKQYKMLAKTNKAFQQWFKAGLSEFIAEQQPTEDNSNEQKQERPE